MKVLNKLSCGKCPTLIIQPLPKFTTVRAHEQSGNQSTTGQESCEQEHSGKQAWENTAERSAADSRAYRNRFQCGMDFLPMSLHLHALIITEYALPCILNGTYHRSQDITLVHTVWKMDICVTRLSSWSIC